MDNTKEKIKELVIKYYEETFKDKTKKTIPASGKVFDEKELLNAIDAVLEGFWTHGKWSEKFQITLANYLGIKHCILVNSGSSANLLAVSSLFAHDLDNKMRKGDEIITAAAGFPTTIMPIIQNGGVPVFVDIKKETHNIDEHLIDEAITERTKAIIAAHTLGNPFNINKIKKICDDNGLFLIEDSCDALGAKYNGRYVSTFGDIGTFSFYPAHHITTAEGGAVVSNNSEIKTAATSIRDWGRDCWCLTGKANTCGKRFDWQLGELPRGYDHKYIYSRLGYNLKNNDILAAIGLAQLEKLPAFTEARKRNATLLKKMLSEFSDYFIFTRSEKNAEPSWFGFVITLCENIPFKRNDIIEHLQKNSIDTRLVFAGNITKQPVFKNYDINYRIHGTLDNSDYVMNNTFWIGLYPDVTEQDITFIYEKCREFINAHKN